MTGQPLALPLAVLLQSAEAEGGPAPLVVAALAVLAVGFLLSVWIAWRLYRGYRGSGDRSMLALATGLVLLTAVPTTVRVLVPTVLGGPATLRIVVASASQIVGLVVILLAIRTPARRRHRVRHDTTPLLVPVLLGVERLVDEVGLLAPGLTAGLGAYVSWQAYRGYRRNDSAPMGWLALGIALLTVAPFAITVGLVILPGVGDATGVLALSLTQLGGLLAVLRSLLGD